MQFLTHLIQAQMLLDLLDTCRKSAEDYEHKNFQSLSLLRFLAFVILVWAIPTYGVYHLYDETINCVLKGDVLTISCFRGVLRDNTMHCIR